MSLDVHLYHHFVPDTQVQSALDALSKKLDLVITNGQQIQHMETKIMAAIDDLQAAVAAEDTVIDSAVALIQGIPALIAAAGVDPAKLAALQTDIASHATTLAAAVSANTPAAPQAGKK